MRGAKNETLRVEILDRESGRYVPSAQSVCLPFLPIDELSDLLRQGVASTDGELTWLKAFREWVRTRVAPRYRGNEGA